MENFEPFELNGIVTKYTGNGRRLGYPTANITIPAGTEEGLFVGYVTLNGARHESLIFIGAPVTLNDIEKRAEAHILDFEDRDLYGEQVVFYVEHKLRNNERFENEASLVNQMDRDKLAAIEYFKDQ